MTKTNWKQKAKEKAEAIQGITKLNWDYYWAYTVNPRSQWMTLKYITDFAEKMVPALANSVCLAQLKVKDSQRLYSSKYWMIAMLRSKCRNS